MNRYRSGRIHEKKVVNDLREKGFENIRRSVGSRGPADVYATRNGQKYYIQVKSGSADVTKEEIKKLKKLAKKRGGTAVVINRNEGRSKWRFFGNWG